MIIITKVDEACLLVKDDLKNVYISKKIEEMVNCAARLLGCQLAAYIQRRTTMM